MGQANENDRTEALGQDDTAPEGAFETITELAADWLDAPLAILSLADTDRIWLKSSDGFGVQQMRGRVGPSASAILQDESDTLPASRQNPLSTDSSPVIGDTGLRFYAVAPLIAQDGRRLGALGVADRVPRSVSERELISLRKLAQLAMNALETGLEARLEQERTKAKFDTSQDALRRSERRLREIIESEPECVKVVSAEGMLLDMNPAGLKMIDAENIDQVRGLPVMGMIHPGDRDAYFGLHRRALNGESSSLEFRVRGLKGREMWMESRSVPLREDEPSAGGSVLSVTRDITARKQLEASRAEMDLRFQQLVDNIGEVYWMRAPEKNKVLFVSAAYESIWGRSCEELYHEPGKWIEAIHREDRERVRQAVNRHTIGEYNEEYRIVRPDGSVRWILDRGFPVHDENGEVFRVVGTAKDVTERKLAELTLRVSEERFRLIAEATSDVVWDWDLVDGHVWWGQGMQEQFGHDPVMMSTGPDSWISRIHPDDVDRVVKSIHGVIDGYESYWTDDYRFRYSSGGFAFVTDRGYVIRDDAGKGIRMVGSMSDVSENRRMEEQIRQSQRLEAVGQLTGGVAHDFNNLLTVIIGNADLLAESLTPASNLWEMANTVAQAAERGAKLTHRLLAFGRRQPLDPRPTNVDKLAAGMDGLLRRSLGEDVEIKIVPGAGLWQALVDGSQLENAILNLCINARDAMPDGGKLTVETTIAYLDEHYARGNPDAQPGHYVMVAVSDSGQGMTEEVAARAFEPFFTTKAVGKGSGLGLSMVYGFVKQSKGHLKIYSEEGQGTTLKLYLPRARKAPEESRAMEEPTNIPGGTEKILLVEDNDLVRSYVMDQLRSLGYQVVAVSNGPEALRELIQLDDIDLLFTDIVMPGGMHGRALAEEAQRLRPLLAVLFTSGYAEHAIVHQGRLDSGVLLLQKPFRRQDLAAKVRLSLDTTKAKAAYEVAGN